MRQMVLQTLHVAMKLWKFAPQHDDHGDYASKRKSGISAHHPSTRYASEFEDSCSPLLYEWYDRCRPSAKEDTKEDERADEGNLTRAT